MGERDGAASILTIDLDAIVANWRVLQDRLGTAACGGVVKADSYGLGARRVAPALWKAGCRHLFVAHLEEALDLRGVLPDEAFLYVLNGVHPGTEREAAQARVIPALNGPEQVAAWKDEAARRGRALPAVLQVDTGMSRLGLQPAELDALVADPQGLAGLDLKFVMSHLACADEPGHPANAQQLVAFEAARRKLPPMPASFANSSGIFLGGPYHFDIARPGVALYGVNPVPGHANPMRNVAVLEARIVQVRDIPPGAHVGYGYRFAARRPTRIATVALGYADGFLRRLGDQAKGWIGPYALPVAGRISMDTISLDASDCPEGTAKAGGFVTFMGPQQTPDMLAAMSGTIGYEVLTSLGSRFRRIYTGGPASVLRPSSIEAGASA